MKGFEQSSLARDRNDMHALQTHFLDLIIVLNLKLYPRIVQEHDCITNGKRVQERR